MPVIQLNPPLPSRPRDIAPTGIVIHATAGGTARSSIDYLRQQGLSYHYIIARDGRDSGSSRTSDGSEAIIFHCVPDVFHAFHVGSTVPVPGSPGSINKNSIGISLANIQKSGANFEPYLKAQIEAFDELIGQVKEAIPSIRWITRHADIQPWNRADPLQVDCGDFARRHGLVYWVPPPDVIRAYTPSRAPIA